MYILCSSSSCSCLCVCAPGAPQAWLPSNCCDSCVHVRGTKTIHRQIFAFFFSACGAKNFLPFVSNKYFGISRTCSWSMGWNVLFYQVPGTCEYLIWTYSQRKQRNALVFRANVVLCRMYVCVPGTPVILTGTAVVELSCRRLGIVISHT